MNRFGFIKALNPNKITILFLAWILLLLYMYKILVREGAFIKKNSEVKKE